MKSYRTAPLQGYDLQTYHKSKTPPIPSFDRTILKELLSILDVRLYLFLNILMIEKWKLDLAIQAAGSSDLKCS